MRKKNLVLVFLLLLTLSSCKSNKILGSWEFIEVYQGVEIKNVDTLKLKQNTSKKGSGILSFNENQTFTSLESKGDHKIEGKVLKMKYVELKDTISLKVSYLDKDYLLLSSFKNMPTTWFYKKIKN